MSRTRGAHRFHLDDGEVFGKGGVPLSPTPGAPIQRVALDRQGRPISPAAARLNPPLKMDGDAVMEGPGAEPRAPVRQIVSYRADPTTWARGAMDGWVAASLLDMALRHPAALGRGFVVEITPDEFNALNGDLRLHFRPIFGEV